MNLQLRSDLSCADGVWGALAPCDHLMQIYDDESAFMDTLERFIDHGLRNGEAAVVIATASHRTWLEARLRAAGHDLVARPAPPAPTSVWTPPTPCPG